MFALYSPVKDSVSTNLCKTRSAVQIVSKLWSLHSGLRSVPLNGTDRNLSSSGCGNHIEFSTSKNLLLTLTIKGAGRTRNVQIRNVRMEIPGKELTPPCRKGAELAVCLAATCFAAFNHFRFVPEIDSKAKSIGSGVPIGKHPNFGEVLVLALMPVVRRKHFEELLRQFVRPLRCGSVVLAGLMVAN